MLQALRIFPQAFQVVKLPLLGVHNVKNDVDIIHQRPLRTIFTTIWTLTQLFLETMLYMVGNGANLRVAASFAQNKKVRDRFVDLPQIETNDALALFFQYRCQNGFENLARAGEALRRLFAGLQAGYEVLQKRRWDCVGLVGQF